MRLERWEDGYKRYDILCVNDEELQSYERMFRQQGFRFIEKDDTNLGLFNDGEKKLYFSRYTDERWVLR